MAQSQSANLIPKKWLPERGQPNSITDDTSSGTLVDLWTHLHNFVGKLEDFFAKGFSGSSPALQVSPDYSPQYIRRRIAEQAGHDMELITRALGQREIYRRSDAPQTALNTLKIADWIANEIALKPAIDAGFLPKITAVTYFEKASHCRVIPYAPVALIGFPFHAMDNIAQIEASQSGSQPRQSLQDEDMGFLLLGDLLAIPHEVGHYLYWHATAHGNHLPVEVYRHVFGNQPQWVLNWLEELYADIYGYVIAGPAAAFQLMELLKAGSQESLLFDDGEHPIPVLRIHAAVYALKILKFPSKAERLKTEWDSWLQTQNIEDKFVPNNGSSKAIKLSDGRRIVEEVVDALIALEFMKLRAAQFNPPAGDPRNRSATTPPNESENATEQRRDEETLLWGDYQDKFQRIISAVQSMGSKPANLPLGPSTQDEQNPQIWQTNTWLDTFLQLAGEMSDNSSAADRPTPTIPAQVWMAAIEAGGWITGPHGSIIPPKKRETVA